MFGIGLDQSRNEKTMGIYQCFILKIIFIKILSQQFNFHQIFVLIITEILCTSRATKC